MTRREQFNRIDLTGALEAMLDARQRHRLQEGAPTHVTVPSGSQVRLDYIPGQAPVLAVKLQEMFGLADTPRVAWGKIPVMLHLLSPARRPIQVTQDLSGFWERTYRDVKKELKGRYPKHPWPDDPRHAVATARTRRSNRKRG
jgi:ATP-dependent helicase HrpB